MLFVLLKESSDTKCDLELLEWTPRLCLCFWPYDMSLISNTFILTMYSVINCLLFMPNLVMQN